jgi:hypothetical protein
MFLIFIKTDTVDNTQSLSNEENFEKINFLAEI